jgi:predicted RecA/RadA family phage recombinase
MNNYQQPGDVLTLTAPSGGVTSGVPVEIGSWLVVPATTAAVGESFEGQLVGVFRDMPKATGETWSVGEILHWDAGNANFTATAAGNLRAGAAVAAAASGDTTGVVRLDGVARPLEAT